jgi:hypothetical protein
VTGVTPQSALDRAIAQSVPEHFAESDVERLVQVITDQIMSAANG